MKNAEVAGEISNVPTPTQATRKLRKLLSKLKVFKEEEFADLLHQCTSYSQPRET